MSFIDARMVYDSDGKKITDKISLLNKKTDGVINVKEFGAVGDGIVDDTQALKDAIAKAQTSKKQLRFEEGKVYLITSPLTITASLSMASSPSSRATIKTLDQTFDPIQVTGFFVAETTLSASATVNTKWMDVANASLIKSSMLIEVISSLPWYHDPRTDSSDCRKAELHRVDEVIGNRIYTTDPLFDGYDLTKETVTIKAYTPIRFHMENVELIMAKAAVPTDSIRKTGITLTYTVDALLENVYVQNAQNCGIFLKHSYRPTVIGGRTQGANNYFSGYGVQTYGTTHAVIKDRHARNCRRGVDVSGGTIPSHYTTVEGCSHFGSGTNSMGDRYAYNDNHTTGAASSGFGTHGGADHTTFRNNYMGFLEVGIISRSRNTVIEGNQFIGDFNRCCISVAYGENNTIKNNYAYDGFTGLKEKGIFDGGANINTRKPAVFILYSYTAMDNGSSGGYFHVQDNFTMVQKTFISLNGVLETVSVPTQENFIVKNNHCFFTPQLSTDDCVFIRNDVPNVTTIYMSGSIVTDNTVKRLSGVGDYLYFKGVDMRNNSQVESPRTYSLWLGDDSSDFIYLGAGYNWSYVRVMVDANSASGLIRLAKDLNSISSIGTPNNIDTSGIPLTGTTGVDGNLTLSFVSGGRLYVENRLGSTQRVLITVMNYL